MTVPAHPPITTIGLMSGTSLDGVDAVLVRFEADRMRQLGRASLSFTPELRSALLTLARGNGANEIESMGDAGVELARIYAEAVHRVLADARMTPGEVDAVGMHGQTIRHRPERGFTIQIGNAALLAELTGIDVVADFRSRDVAAGGEGAPLVPAFHAEAFRGTEPRIILNIGGIANASFLPAQADPDAPVSGYDTGPGNMLLDAWVRRTTGEAFDRDGRLSGAGRVMPELLEAALRDPYFSRKPPKSTGREHFSEAWLDRFLESAPPRARASDIARTLAALTAEAAAREAERTMPSAESLFVCGGGSLNPVLMAELESRFAARTAVRRVDATTALGIAPMDVEGAAFAWLAMRFLAGEPGNLPSATKAKGRRILGALYPAR